MAERLLIVPLFIPHQGCRHGCVFCNQHRIGGALRPISDAATVAQDIEAWLNHGGQRRRRVQVAFYGGSFTGLDPERQRLLLGAVRPFLEQGRVHSIRCSTRPDLIDGERLALLRDYGVDLVELGVQSLDDAILLRCRRGHDAGQVQTAVARLKASGIGVGIQLMIGLPGERFVHVRRTVGEVVGLRPDCVRIYPTLAIEGSQLADWYRQGRFRPLSLARAILLAAWMKKRFDAAAIPVIRLGLQPSPELEASLVAGPHHPAFGQLVASRLMLQQTRRLLAGIGDGRSVRLLIAPQDLSTFQGQGGDNRRRLEELGLSKKFILEPRAGIARHEIRREEIP